MESPYFVYVTFLTLLSPLKIKLAVEIYQQTTS